jgi:hypothetical protein
MPRPLLAAVLVLLAACGPRMHASQALLSDHPHRLRNCRVSALPAALPRVAQVVDSAPLLADVRSAWRASGERRGYVLVSLRFDTSGVNVRRAVVETDVAKALADSVQQLVFAHRTVVEHRAEEWGVRLRVELGDEPAARVGRWEVCDATPRDPFLERMAGGWDVRAETPFIDPRNVVWLRLRVDARGVVQDAQIERSLVPARALEWRLINYARSIAFVPATEDGYAVPSETSIALPLS